MGGNSVMKHMKKLCVDKDADIIGTGIVNWGNKNREKMIDAITDDFKRLLGKDK